MKFGIFYEHQLPRPWEDGSEQQLISDALEQCELADRLGVQYVWEVCLLYTSPSPRDRG